MIYYSAVPLIHCSDRTPMAVGLPAEQSSDFLRAFPFARNTD